MNRAFHNSEIIDPVSQNTNPFRSNKVCVLRFLLKIRKDKNPEFFWNNSEKEKKKTEWLEKYFKKKDRKL